MKCSKLNSKLRNIHDDEKSSLKKETATQPLAFSVSSLLLRFSHTHHVFLCVVLSSFRLTSCKNNYYHIVTNKNKNNNNLPQNLSFIIYYFMLVEIYYGD